MLGDGTKKRQCIISKKRTDVVEKMRAEMAMADRGMPVLRDRRTTGEYLNHWMLYIAPKQLRPTTLRLYSFTMRRYLLPLLCNALKPIRNFDFHAPFFDHHVSSAVTLIWRMWLFYWVFRCNFGVLRTFFLLHALL